MKNPSRFLLFLCSITLLLACKSFFKVSINIDNPTTSVITVEVDGESYDIESNSSIEIKLVKGEHLFTASEDGEEIFNETISVTAEGILNPTHSTYVVHKELYLQNQDQYQEYAEKALKMEDREINDKTYEDVDFVVYEGQSFIPKNWDYGLDVQLPEEIKTDNEDFQVMSKLYRLNELETTWGFFGDFDFTQTSDAELKNFLDSLQNLLQDSVE